MQVRSLVAALAAAAMMHGPALAQNTRTAPQSQSIAYPPSPRGDVVENLHGSQVADPYRWLEEYSEQTNAWIQAQSELTFDYLKSIPQRDAIQRRLTTLWNFERYSAPSREGTRYFFSKNDGLQNQSVVYVSETLTGEPRVLLDPNTLSKDGTVALAGMSVTDDGSLMAYAVAEAGSDWNIWRVRDVATGKDLPDELRWVKFSSAAWTKDNKGFFYSRFAEPGTDQKLKSVNENHKIYFHKLGDEQSKDVLVYERPDQPKWYLFSGVTEDGRYLIINVEPGDKLENGIFYKDLSTPDSKVVEFLNKFDTKYSFVGNDGPIFFITSELDAPRGRVYAIDTRNPDRANWREIIPQAAETLSGVNLVGERLFASYLKDAQTVVRMFALDGKPMGEVQLPGIGTAGGFSGKRAHTETFYSFTSYTTPATVYRYEITTGKSEVFRKPKVGFNPDDYQTTQVFYNSKDGTRVPMFITHKKGLSLDGSNPTILYGYGGFNIPLTPGFSVANLIWMEMGGVYAVANLRGGGEYGDEWHKAGTRLNKQNVFDDFIAAAEWLIANRYTRPDKLAIMGGSNGGLLVGAVLNQRPELFGAAIPAVGVMDMLRFHKFTVGWGWVGDYGSADNPEEFKALMAYSPLHNIREGVCYPPVMVTTADHDDRVYPAHSFKYAAALQAAQSKNADCANPTLIRIETRAGHGAGKPTSKRIEEAADMWAFFVKSLKMDPKLPDDQPMQ